jgi:hypothetical protein
MFVTGALPLSYSCSRKRAVSSPANLQFMITHYLRPIESLRRTKGELGPSCLAAGAGFEPAGGFLHVPITQALRPV